MMNKIVIFQYSSTAVGLRYGIFWDIFSLKIPILVFLRCKSPLLFGPKISQTIFLIEF